MAITTLNGHVEDATLIRSSIGDEIVLDNVPLKVERLLGYQLSNVYGRGQRQGEPGPDDHQYDATNTQRNWLSGCLVRESQEAADIGKYWTGHAWTQTRGALGHALKVVRLRLPADAPPGPCIPLGRLEDRVYWAVGWREGWILEHDVATDSLIHPEDVVRQFDGLVTNTGATWRLAGETPDDPQEWLYVPTTLGYTRIKSGTYQTVDVEDWATVAFSVNQNKLYRLTARGEIFFAIEHDDSWAFAGVITDGSEARNLYRTYDDDGNRCPGVSTSSGLWLLDHDNAILWDTDLTYPEHVFQGYGACNWRGDDFISVGIGIHRKVGSLVTPAGLDDDDGLPGPFAGGLIVDLAPSYNVLAAALASEPPPEVVSYTPPPIETTEIVSELLRHAPGLPTSITTSALRTTSTPQAEVFLPDSRVGAIYVYNGLGWHEVHTWNRAPTRVMVTMIRNSERLDRSQHLLFGDVDGGAYAVKIPSTYYNPIESPSLPLDRRSFLEESRIDWNVPDVPKIAKQINIRPDKLYHQLVEDGPAYFNEIQVVCKWVDIDGLEHTSEDPDILSGPGPYPFSDGVQPLPYLELRADRPEHNIRRSSPLGWERYRNTGALLPTGLPHEAIWFLYRFIGDPRSDYTGGVIKWRTIIARKWMRPTRMYTITIPLQTANKDMDETEMMRFLDSICLKHGGVPLAMGDEFTLVDITRLDGGNEAGMSPRGSRTITALDMRDYTYEQPLDYPNG